MEKRMQTSLILGVAPGTEEAEADSTSDCVSRWLNTSPERDPEADSALRRVEWDDVLHPKTHQNAAASSALPPQSFDYLHLNRSLSLSDLVSGKPSGNSQTHSSFSSPNPALALCRSLSSLDPELQSLERKRKASLQLQDNPSSKRMCSAIQSNVAHYDQGRKCNGKSVNARSQRGTATDPQSVYARHRRERINERLKTLQKLVPNGAKVDISTMLEEAINYIKFLQLQVKFLSSDEYWMFTPIAYNGVHFDFDLS